MVSLNTWFHKFQTSKQSILSPFTVVPHSNNNYSKIALILFYPIPNGAVRFYPIWGKMEYLMFLIF